ncbi:MAG TPA: hypothetical protein PKC18_02965 [Lacipirellulaceae bacterium]|nr:hypothetical protein [Lacipirellulaceae bacterium]HMP08067.1 hypothetical protein [Lacipirellulaceae bacterium]
MVKRILMVAVLGIAGLGFSAQRADAGVIIGPVAPVRRAARVVLPPYPVARHVVARPLIHRPYVVPVYRPVVYAAPAWYGAGPVVFGY